MFAFLHVRLTRVLYFLAAEFSNCGFRTIWINLIIVGVSVIEKRTEHTKSVPFQQKSRIKTEISLVCTVMLYIDSI